MKRLLMFLTILLCSPSLIYADSRCLLIGIGKYPEDSGWKEISSINDVNLLKQSLSSTFSVRVLANKDATHDRIIEEIKRIMNESQLGDTVLIHFSCHGQQVITNDENEPDGLDEALVPYDAKSEESEAYHGENHLLDNELGELILPLRKKVGSAGLVVITLDACFSDSMQRGSGKEKTICRGGADIFGSNFISEDSLRIIEKKRKTIESVGVEPVPDGANLILLSACKSYERNREIMDSDGIGYGSLSYAMWLSFQGCDLGDMEDWLNEVWGQMRYYVPGQTPQIRTTIDYKFPEPPIPPSPTIKVDTQSTSHKLYVILIGALAVLIILSIVLWKKKRK